MNRKCPTLVAAVMLASCFALASVIRAQTPGDPLEQGFLNPPDSAKPRVWWHWTGGNVTKEGISKDLEWMKRVGIGGAQFTGVAGGDQKIAQPITFGSPEWYDAIKHAAAESERLGLELAIFSSSGWSQTGGPWVKPEESMKNLTWSQTDLKGPMKYTDKLPKPPTGGTFGGLRGLNAGRGGAARGGTSGFYGDSAVVAFRTPADETLMEELKPKVTSGGREINGAALWDDNLGTSAQAAAGPDGIPTLQYEFAEPLKIRAVTIMGGGIPQGQIQVSDNGTDFRTVADMPGPVSFRAGSMKTYAFPETTARFVRVRVTGPALFTEAVVFQPASGAQRGAGFSEFIVHTGARVDLWEEKAGFNFIFDYEKAYTPPAPAESLINPAEVIDLTSKMGPDGTLNWDVPAGKWSILRMGYSLIGKTNTNPMPGGSGLEVDKLNAKHVESYFHGYMDPIEKAIGPLMGKTLSYMVMDSWEAGWQNWTDDMIAQFAQRRGYDPRPFLPVLSGRVVGSADQSDRFLWDFRRTLADLLADAHYGTMDKLLKQKGMKGIYGESAGVTMEIMEDTLLNKSKLEVPMGEFWLGKMHPAPTYYVDVRMAASAAHVYGKQFVATESFTGGGYDPPTTYKNLGDYWFAQGVNRIVMHSSPHQPLDTKPGNTMAGTHFNRNITWAEQAKPFVSYLSRNSYLLSQGLFVADFVFLLNEGVPSTQSFVGAGLQTLLPDGYDYDTINADALLTRATAGTGGRMVLSDGMSYRIMVLPQAERIRPEVLRKIRDLVVNGGLTLVGPKPKLSPSLQGSQQKADLEVQALADELWGDLDGAQRNKHYAGKGLVVWGLSLTEVAALAKVAKDVEFAAPLDSDMVWIHRRAGDAEIYFVANRTDSRQEVPARFRVDGKEAELWHPDTGAIEPADYRIANGRTIVPLRLDQRESVFVVFRKPAAAPQRVLPAVATTTLAAIAGPWNVAFQPNLGAPEKIELAKLESWTANADNGVKYFSGTATYTKTIEAQQAWFGPGAKLVLDLGSVRDIAEVAVNGKAVGTLWKPPYVIDVTEAIKPGANQLEIKVTNEWNNRIAGDTAVGRSGGTRVLPGGGGGFSFGPAPSPADSGLLGPVNVLSRTSQGK
jgi:hypothetical protein